MPIIELHPKHPSLTNPSAYIGHGGRRDERLMSEGQNQKIRTGVRVKE